MNFVYKLFSYTYKYDCQGTDEYAKEYALLHVPENATLANNKSTLYKKRNQKYHHEIDFDSIQDLTITF